ncbi:hypothetical protein GCM10027076_19670 [Nocardioides montaniterrae]
MVGVVLLLACALIWFWRWTARDDGPAVQPKAVPTASATPSVPGPCARRPARSFVPQRLEVTGVVSRVVPVPRDSGGIMGVLPEGIKTEFAADLGGVLVGSATGHVLFNTHTWPDGSAMGNRLLARLQVGGRLVVSGHGLTQCYRVVARQEVLASNGYPGWDRTDGRPEAVIVVCSGTRLGPGSWTHRTLWFARPYFGGKDAA